MALRMQPTQYSEIQTVFALGGLGEDVATNMFAIQTRDGEVELVTETGLGDDHVALLGAVPGTDEWHGVVFVFDDGVARYYLDGALVNTRNYTLAETASPDLKVGISAWDDRHWVGLMDDMRVYAEPLDEEAAIFLSTL